MMPMTIWWYYYCKCFTKSDKRTTYMGEKKFVEQDLIIIVIKNHRVQYYINVDAKWYLFGTLSKASNSHVLPVQIGSNKSIKLKLFLRAI